MKKAVKVPSFKSWFPPKKVCTKDAACVAANAKCGKTLATLHEQLGTLTAAADAAGKAKDAAKGDAAKVATAAKAAAALAESMKATAAADASAMQASVTEIAHLRVQAAMDKEDSAASQKALMTAMTNHKMLVQAHQKSKLLAVQAAARALGAESNAAKAAAAPVEFVAVTEEMNNFKAYYALREDRNEKKLAGLREKAKKQAAEGKK